MARQQVSMSIMAVSIIGLLGVPSAFASMEKVADVNVPFTFTAGGTTWPSGPYVVKLDRSDPTVLRLESVNGRTSGWMFTTGQAARHSSPEGTELVFDKDGSNYYLREIWISEMSVNGREGFELMTAPQEARAAGRRQTEAAQAAGQAETATSVKANKRS